MTGYLLDVNMLLALIDPMHVHHESSRRWFVETGHPAWATCPITENGFLRIASHPNYPNRPGSVAAVLSILQRLCEMDGHNFWPDEPGILRFIDDETTITHTQITDVYLLGLAAHHRGKLATLDRHIPAHAVRGGREALEIVAA